MDPIPPPTITANFPDLAGRVAIVTGGSRGIGPGIGAFLGRQGMRLLLAARNEERGQAVIAALAAEDIAAAWCTADLATPEGARHLIQTALAEFGQIDLLVNNAAQLHSKPFHKLDEDWYRSSVERNLRLVYGPSYEVVQHWLARERGGTIVHLSSVGGLRAHAGLAGYDASKGAIDALTRNMAIDLARYGIRVNAVAPGATSHDETGHDAYRGHRTPLDRTVSREEIGAAVAFLASDAACAIRGQVLYVDGGMTAQLGPPGTRM